MTAMNVLMVSAKGNKNLNPEALNTLVGGTEGPFLKCNYELAHGKIRFYYEANGAMPLCDTINTLGVAVIAEQLCRLIRYMEVHRLSLSNIVLRKRYIFIQVEAFKFIYLPIYAEKNLTTEDFVYDFLKCLGKKSLFTYIYAHVMERMERTLEISPLGEGEMGTTLLGSSEEETTLLSGQQEELGLQMQASNESETTLFDAQPDINNEGETTLFSVQQNVKKVDLVFLRNATGERIYISKTPFVFGKDSSSADFVIENRFASRVHATINYQNGEYYITDNGSANGTIVEGTRLEPHKLEVIENASLISFGTESFQAIIERR